MPSLSFLEVRFGVLPLNPELGPGVESRGVTDRLTDPGLGTNSRPPLEVFGDAEAAAMSDGGRFCVAAGVGGAAPIALGAGIAAADCVLSVAAASEDCEGAAILPAD